MKLVKLANLKYQASKWIKNEDIEGNEISNFTDGLKEATGTGTDVFCNCPYIEESARLSTECIFIKRI